MNAADSNELILILVIGTLGMLILALGIFFFFLFYQKRLLTHQLEMNRIKNEQQQAMLRATVFAQENERKRFAEDLHDEIGAMLSAVKLNLGRLEKKTEEPRAKQLASETKGYLDEVIFNIRRITRALLPPSLEKSGLGQAIAELVNWINKSETVDIRIHESGLITRFAVKREMAVFRMVQELLNNSLKYAGAPVINVHIRYLRKALWIVVSDNGKGFDPAEARHKGLGLQNLESRASVLNGRIKLKSKPGRGTSAILTIPLNDEW